ncbi:MAG: fatty acid desaturase [Labilithrix sp.]|nr:fatty acid desaturase [Labilithrix sp.]MCW5817904.1 fatty acid desaturase [Labilithrix sp.]
MPQPNVDPSTIDCHAFFRELRAIRLEAEAALGEEDIRHLRRTILYGRTATAVGLATAWFPNPLSMAALALGRSTRWIVMHHIGHRGYDRVPGVPEEFTSRTFAKGWRRFVDWSDWMLPEAWKYEHNVLHHTNTGELKDPDLVERNTHWVRGLDVPDAVKAGIIGLLAMTWRPFYYAPNTVSTWLSRGKSLAFTDETAEKVPRYRRTLYLQCYAPYVFHHFVALPALFLPLGPFAAMSAFVNSLGAEALCGIHTFLVIAPNHTGDDVYRFDAPSESHAESAVRQVLGSVNYATGTELVDYAQLWLNYQIEHHLFPDLPMLAYRKIQPKVQALCAKHGIPYVQESLWKRAKQLVSIAVGRTSMKRASRVGKAPLETARAAAE